METALTKNRKKQLSQDLWIICIVSFAVLAVCMLVNDKMKSFVFDPSINIVLRVLVVGVGGQFGLAGLGIIIVCILRKEKFQSFGLNTKNLIPALLLSLACCIPDFIYCVISGNVHAWCPFWDVNTTPELLKSGFPYNVLGMLITAVCWGFFEGFNYVVIRDKLSELYPSRSKFWDWGALVCAIMCILVHGAIGVTPDAVVEMLVTMFLIYGMLLVRKLTGNAWGCVLIFMVYWNAI